MRAIIGLLLLLLTSCSECTNSDPHLPMYGGADPTPREKAADERFIAGVIETFGSKTAGAAVMLRRGWEAYDAGDKPTAIRRFNQAWLLVPDDARVIEAFGIYLNDRGDYDEAIRYFELALRLDPNAATAMCNMGRSYKEKSMRMLRSGNGRQQLLEEALWRYERAADMGVKDKELSYIYYHWAIALAMNGNSADAWDKVHLSQDHGGEFIEAGFLAGLAKDMPEPPH